MVMIPAPTPTPPRVPCISALVPRNSQLQQLILNFGCHLDGRVSLHGAVNTCPGQEAFVNREGMAGLNQETHQNQKCPPRHGPVCGAE